MSKVKHAKQVDVFENVEYLQVYKNRKPMLLIEDREINGKSKTEIQKMIGERLGAGHYRTSIKYFGDPKNASGSIVAIVPGEDKNNSDSFDSERLSFLEKKIDKIAESFGKNSGTDLTLLMNMKDQAYQIQIEFYKNRIEVLEAENKNLKEQLNELDKGTDSTSDLITQLLPLLLKSKGE